METIENLERNNNRFYYFPRGAASYTVIHINLTEEVPEHWDCMSWKKLISIPVTCVGLQNSF